MDRNQIFVLRWMLCGVLIGAGAILPGVSGGVLAVVFGLFAGVLGLTLSYYNGVATGPTIILVLAAVFCLV